MQARSVRTTEVRPRLLSLRTSASGLLSRSRDLRARLQPGPIVPEPYEEGVTPLRQLLLRPALIGLVAVVAIVVGASQTSSPFTLTKVPGSWFFGIPPRSLVPGSTPPPGQGLFVGVVLVYAGMVVMMRAWYDLYRVTVRHPGIPVRKLAPVFVVWVLPLLVVAPLFSRDVYSYAAQGEMMSHGINPYSYGPGVLGVNSWVNPVDPLWLNVTSPYGPLFLAMAGAIVNLSGHNALLSVLGLRGLAVIGVVLIAVFLPRLARSYGFDGTTAFALVLLNPLVLLHLVGGAHNDALMLGLLVAGLAMARTGRPVVGVALVALATAVKVPAAIGVVYIGWEWLGDGVPWRQRVRPMISAFLVAGAVMAAVTEAVGLGWGWVRALGTPDSVKSYLDPATALGLLAGDLARGVGFADHARGILSIVRGLFFLAAILVGAYLLLRSDRKTSGRALGLTMLAVTVLGPVTQPWYIVWAVVFLGAVAEGRVRSFVILLSCTAPFLGLPGGLTLIDEITVANPFLVAIAAMALASVAGLLLVPRLRRGLATRERRPRPPALVGQAGDLRQRVREGAA